MLTVQDLRKPVTRAEALEWLLLVLQSAGFETTGWQDGRIQKTLLLTGATVFSDLSEIGKSIVEFGFNAFSSGDPLSEFSFSRFGSAKVAAVHTVGPMRLTSTASIPYTVQPGQLIAATASGIEFRNTTGGTVPAGGSVVLTWRARLAGELAVARGAVNVLLTPLAGVTVSNDEADPWYTTAGADEQSDASIKQQNSTQWSRLSVELIGEAYKNIAIKDGNAAGVPVAKVALDDQNPRGAGTIDVYCAGASSLLGTSDMETLQALFATRTFQTDSAWPPISTSRVELKHPSETPLNLAGSIYHDPAFSSSDVQARVEQALRDFLAAIPIGGYVFTPGPANIIPLDDLYDTIKDVEGVRKVTLTSPTADTSVGVLALITEGTWSLTYTPVTT